MQKKILILSIHKLFDNRIRKHIKTLSGFNFDITYYNISESVYDNSFSNYKNFKLVHIKKTIDKRHIFTYFIQLFKLGKYIRNSSFDFVHFHDPLLLPVTICAKSTKAKIVYDRHESYEKMNGINAKFSALLERFYWKYINGIVYVNQAQYAFIAKRKSTINKLIPNYQLISDYYTSDTTDSILDSNKVKLIYIGTLTNKSRETIKMLNICERILYKYNNVEFILGGQTDETDVNEKIQNMVQKLKNLRYYGQVDYSQVITLTKESDIGLYFPKNLANNQKSSPNKVYEYLLSGLCIVSSGDFMHSEEINNKCGFVYPYDQDTESIISDIEMLIDNRFLLKEFKKKSFEIGLKYTWDDVSKQYISLYNDLLI